MSIINIEILHKHDDGDIYISALIENAVEIYSQSLYDPAEYAPALCEASFSLDEDQTLPEDEYELIQFLESLDLEWNVIDNSDYYD
jgi:hypothetical protein